MTTDRELLEMALEALDYEAQRGNDNAYEKERSALRTALSRKALDELAEIDRELGLDDMQPDLARVGEVGVWGEPVAHSVVAGALFDFMGWLTSRDKRLTLSSTDEASPAVEAITKFAKMRGLSLDDARVQDWQDNTTSPQRTWVGLTDEEILSDDTMRYYYGMNGGAGPVSQKGKKIVAAIEAKLKEKNT